MTKKIIWLLVVLHLAISGSGARALTPQQEAVLLSRVRPTISVDLTQLQTLPANILNYSGGLAGASTCTNSSGVIVLQTTACFDHTPSGAPLGLRIWHAVTNVYLNSGAPATQTVVVASGLQYTISFWGAGTLALTGACTHALVGAAGTLTSFSCTTTTTVLVATDTGLTATAYPQIEAAPYAGPRCITAGTSATCPLDLPSLTTYAAGFLIGNPGTFIIEANTVSNSSNLVSFATPSYNMYVSNDNGVSTSYAFATMSGPLGSGNWFLGARVGLSWSGVTYWGSGNGSAAITVNGRIAPSGTIFLGSNGSATVLDGYVRKIAEYNVALSGQQLQSRTVLGSQF